MFVSPPPAPTLVTLSLRMHFSGALVPAVSPGFGIAFGARSAARWGFLVAGWYTMPQTGQQGLGDIEVGLTRVTAGVTFDVLRSRRVRVVLGAGPSLGALHVAVREPEPVTDAGDFSFIAAELGVTLQAAVSEGILMELGGAGLVPLRRQEFLARGQQEPIWRQPAVSGVAFAGLGTLFP